MTVRLIYKKWGIAIDKPVFNGWFPTWYIFFGGVYHISYDYFHSGSGFHVRLPKINILFCTSGKVGWWLDKGRLIIEAFGFKYSR
jgi:hypothetical protein